MAVKTIEEMNEMAYMITLEPVSARPWKWAAHMRAMATPGFALYEYWKNHKDVGTPASPEFDVDLGTTSQDGQPHIGRGLITARGLILLWNNANVQVL